MNTIDKDLLGRLRRLGDALTLTWPHQWAQLAGTPLNAAGPGTPPPAGDPASTGAGAGAAGGTATNDPQDPFGFNSAVQRAPEHLRDMLQQEFSRVGPQLQQRMEQFQPLEPHMDTLSKLTQPDDQGNVPLQGLLAWYELATDPEKIDDFYGWWEQVGIAQDFFDDDDDGQGDGTQQQGAAGDQGGQGTGDPRDQQIAELREMVTGLQQRLDGNDQESALQTQMQQTQQQLQTLMQTHGIDPGWASEQDTQGKQPHEAPNAQTILRLAQGYGQAENALDLAVAEYLRITGAGGQQLLNGAGQPTTGVDQLLDAARNGTSLPGPSGGHAAALSGGRDAHEPEPVGSWDTAKVSALQRLRAAGG